jgi:DNA-binding NtrC family response regulator
MQSRAQDDQGGVVAQELPVIVVVEQGSGDLRSPSRLLQERFKVVTCPVESVALEYVSESRPAAVLLDADTYYLEGAPIVERWSAASPGTRVIFVDTDGPWALLMEPTTAESGEMAINPCASEHIGSAVDELLGHDARRKECQDGRMAFVAV